MTFPWARTTGSVFLLQVAQVGLLFVVQVLFARALGADGFGVYAFALALATYLLPVATMGLDLLATRELPRSTAIARIRGWRFIGFGTVVIVLVSFTLGSLVTALLPGGRVQAVALFVVLPMLACIRFLEASARGLGRVWAAFAPKSLIRPGTLLALVVAFLLSDRIIAPIDAIGFQVVACAATAVVLAFVVLAGLRPPASRAGATGRAGSMAVSLSGWLRRGLRMAPIPTLRTFLAQSDIVLVGIVMSDAETGVYVAARQLSLFAGFGLTALNSTVGPAISVAATSGTLTAIAPQLRRGARLVTGAGLFLLVVYLAFGREILGLFGAEFREAWFVLILLTVGQLVNCSVGPVALTLSLSGDQSLVVRGFALGLATTVVALLLLFPPWGIAGAATAVLLSTVVWNLVLLRDLRRSRGISTAALG